MMLSLAENMGFGLRPIRVVHQDDSFSQIYFYRGRDSRGGPHVPCG